MNQTVVLFICSGNSGRSIMAEALLRQVGGGRFQAFSAGSRPTGRINPRTLSELARRGCDLAGLASKSWDQFAGDGARELDYVISVCSRAADQVLPQWPGTPQRLSWVFPAPGQAQGTDEEIQAAFRDVCGQIERKIKGFVKSLSTDSSACMQHIKAPHGRETRPLP
jgi:arsenate reductase